MKATKKWFFMALWGFPTGVFIGHSICVVSSLLFGNGSFYPAHPNLIALLGNEVNAVAVQTLLCGIIGSVFSMSSLIWRKENWSIFRQTAVYFLITALTMLPIAYFTHWMEHSFRGFLVYTGIFVFLFVAFWLIFYFAYKKRLAQINRALNNKN